MTYSLRFVPEIEEDVRNGYIWYETKSKGLGEDFLRIFYAGTSEIARNPLRYPKVSRDFRRRLLRRFPYAVYFAVENEKVIVYGLFHCARHPQNISEKLQCRE